MELPVIVRRLRAAGEPSRLRLLALCAQGALSVSDLAQALAQSDPRVSRHLRILSEAGLVMRIRDGQWVHYGIAGDEEAASFVRGLLAQLDASDPLVMRDRNRARSLAAHGTEHGGESRLGRALTQLVAADGGGHEADAALVVGVGHPELLEWAARVAGRCTAIAHSRRAAQGARAFAERRGFSCRVLQAAGAGGLSEADLVRAGGAFDLMLLDSFASGAGEGGAALAALLARACRSLVPGGRLWVFERYEALERARGRVVEHPLARLRRLLADAGLECERLSPIEADGEHVLAAGARAAALPGELGRESAGSRA